MPHAKFLVLIVVLVASDALIHPIGVPALITDLHNIMEMRFTFDRGISMLLANTETKIEVFSGENFMNPAKLGFATLAGIVPFVAFNKVIAPKLGMIDRNAPEYEDGKEPWK
jgi:hypothetical protein